MEIGLIGVGRMGAGLLRRWRSAGHDVVAFDANSEAASSISEAGAVAANDVDGLIQKLTPARVVWLMIPAGEAVEETINALAKKLEPGDIVIDGGNSNYKDSMRHFERLAKRDIHFIDAGVSGGTAGEQAGYALMVGGEEKTIASVQSLFDAVAAPDAFAHVGEAGSGHFIKMVHNAIEYGMMQAIGEGFDLLKNGPFRDLDLSQIATMWSHGTIIRSFLMELTAKALERDGKLAGVAGYVDDSGEGRWSVEAAVDHAVPFFVNTAALYARFDSRLPDSFSAKVIAALRREFGGHTVKTQETRDK